MELKFEGRRDAEICAGAAHRPEQIGMFARVHRIAAQLDPEEWRETVSSYHRAAAEAITRFGGHVAKHLGDGVMAYFGYPEAQNDAERAASAGLAIVDVISKLNQHSARSQLSARIGIEAEQ